MLKHQHIIIRAEVLNPPQADDTDKMNFWFKDLIESIDMKILMGPFTVYSHMIGNRGFTGICAIETSHIAFHAWDEESPGVLQLDVYTCAHLDLDIVIQKLKQFNPTKVEYCFIDRDDDLEILNQGTLTI